MLDPSTSAPSRESSRNCIPFEIVSTCLLIYLFFVVFFVERLYLHYTLFWSLEVVTIYIYVYINITLGFWIVEIENDSLTKISVGSGSISCIA